MGWSPACFYIPDQEEERKSQSMTIAHSNCYLIPRLLPDFYVTKHGVELASFPGSFLKREPGDKARLELRNKT